MSMFGKMNIVQRHCMKSAILGVIIAIIMAITLNILSNFFVWFIALILAAFFLGYALCAGVLILAFRSVQVVE